MKRARVFSCIRTFLSDRLPEVRFTEDSGEETVRCPGNTKQADNCFAPLASPAAQLLILGSYPGVTSLEKRQYYAHPRNAFWDIIADIVGFERNLDYRQKASILKQAGIALWDVLYSCRRPGSLDSRIESSSIIINDFNTFFQNHPMIKVIVFNGAKAEQEFRKRVLPASTDRLGSKLLLRLPSTSPAMASLSYGQKLESWNVIADYLQRERMDTRSVKI